MLLFRYVRAMRGCLAAGAIGVVLAAGPALADDPPPDACDVEGTATGPCTITIQLGTRPLARTFPFDVPVFLTGSADPLDQGLRLHLFAARHSFRLAEACEDQSLPLEKCPADQRKLTCSSHENSKPSNPQSTWTFADLKGAGAEPEDCSLQALVSTWQRASLNDNTFMLRVPPQPANRYFALFLEVERTPSDTQKQELKNDLARAVDEAVGKALSNQGGTFRAWIEDLHKGICDAVKAVARRKGVRLEVTDGSLLDCDEKKQDRIREAATSELFNALSDMRVQLRTLLEVGSDLENLPGDFPAELPTLKNLTVELQFGLGEINDPNFFLEPSMLKGDLADRLTIESSKMAASSVPEIRALAPTVAASASFLKQSQEKYAELQRITEIIAVRTVILTGSNIGSFLTRQRAYLAADFGVLYAWDVDEALPYIGTNIYFVPVNKQAPLGWREGWKGKRYGVTLGVTVGEFGRTRAEPLFSSVNGVTGFGVRLTESIRLAAGAVWFREADENPLSNDKQTVFSYYGSLSFDYDVNSLIKWFNTLFNPSSR